MLKRINFDLLPMEHVRRLELLSGSGGLLGANSLGGAINLITRRGTGPGSRASSKPREGPTQQLDRGGSRSPVSAREAWTTTLAGRLRE